MENLVIKLQATNSSGEQVMVISRDPDEPEEFFFTLYGVHEGKELQVDFNLMTRPELEEIKAAVDAMLEA